MCHNDERSDGKKPHKKKIIVKKDRSIRVLWVHPNPWIKLTRCRLTIYLHYDVGYVSQRLLDRVFGHVPLETGQVGRKIH